MSDLSDFLLARIAEDEAEAWRWNADAGTGDWDSLEERVLAECEAKRRIVDEATELLGLNEGTSVWMAAAAHARRTLRHLAAVYSDHPDYRQEWKA